MSDTDSLDYLQAGFNPATLTVPRLRSILVSYNIAYPASAKKPQLIELFEENVLPQSKKILSARARARRTSKGITNADPSEDSTTVGDEERMPPPPTPRVRGSSRKSSARIKVEDSESETAPPRSPTKRTPRISSARTLRASDEDEAIVKSVRKTRKSEPPVIKSEEDETPRRPLDNSVFSHDNPFQSGSSPPSGGRTPIESRRKSSGVTSSRRKSTSRRRTDGAPFEGSTSRTFELPVSKLNGLTNGEDDGVEAGEEFTPEEQMELVRERSAKGVNAIVPRPKKKTKSTFKAPFGAVFLALLGGYAAWYRQEKVAVGYCGVGREAHPLDQGALTSKVDVPDWTLELIEPQCQPCPQHAYCYKDLRTNCEVDFLLKHHPLSLNGLLPIAPTCEPDGEKVRKIQAVADRAIEELRERRADWECGSLTDKDGAPAPTVEIDAQDLKESVSKKRRRGMSEAEFEELWTGALGEIKGREEVESNIDGLVLHLFIPNIFYNSKHPYTKSHSTNQVLYSNNRSTQALKLSSNSLARISLSCALRRTVRLSLARHRLQIGVLGLLVAAYFYLRFQYRSYMSATKAIPQLVSMTLDKLSERATLSIEDPQAFPEPWISIGQLRDDVLRAEHNPVKRERLWQKVRKVVELNANVRASQRESRNGELSRVWEWIGAVSGERLLEDGGRRSTMGGRKSSNRVSWGEFETEGRLSSPVSGTDDGPEMVQAKWREGRPVY